MKTFYQRKLPHWQPRNASFFITYRLEGSLPSSIIQKFKIEYLQGKNSFATDELRRKQFLAYENALEKMNSGPHWLMDDEIASTVMESLLFQDNKEYKLLSATIMSNHVHTVLKTFPESQPLFKILQNHKKFTARLSIQILGRSGKFWAEESFDSVIRDQAHFYRAINYCIQNPVKAGLVKSWDDWRWTYVDPIIKQKFINQ